MTKLNKTRHSENFPVGSWLIAKPLRGDVHTYYNFARLADDVADTPDLEPGQKLQVLNALETALRTGDASPDLEAEAWVVAHDLGRRLLARNLDFALASDLLIAFRRDSENRHCRTWDDLIDYCRWSACPVGRFLLALHGEIGPEDKSDSLCTALQILNHLQDIRKDQASLGRCYLPQDWRDELGIMESDLVAATATAPLRSLLDRILDRVTSLLVHARTLPAALENRRLALETRLVLNLAGRLLHRLRHNDPMSGKVKLTPLDWGIAVFSIWRQDAAP